MAHQLEVGLANQVPYVFFRTAIEIINADDVIAIVNESLTEVRTDKSSSACNQYSFHIKSFCFNVGAKISIILFIYKEK